MKGLVRSIAVLLAACCILSGQGPTPGDYHGDLSEAEKLFAKGDLDGVIRTLAPWAEKYPDRTEAHHGLGLAYYQQQDFAATIRHLSAALRLEAEGSAPWKQTVEILGMAYYFSNRSPDALPLLEKAAQWSKDNKNLLYTLAMTHLYTHDRDNARRVFAQLFGIAPESRQAFLLTADLMVQENYSADAEALIQEVGKKWPELPEVHYKLGLIAFTKGQYAEAVQYLEKELAANPSHSLAWHYLGDAYIRLGRIERAIDPLQRSLWLNRNATRSYILLANVYAQQGRFFVAENSLKRALQMDPQSYEAHFLLARIYHKTNRPELAKEEMAVAEKLRAANETRK